jgi:acetyl-CoA synthetase (ADP-forming)
VLAEAVADVALRLVPLEALDAHEMLDQLASQALLGPFRGEPALDRDATVSLLLALASAAGTLVGDDERIVSVDLNPLIVCDGRPVAVDALVEVDRVAEVAA